MNREIVTFNHEFCFLNYTFHPVIGCLVSYLRHIIFRVKMIPLLIPLVDTHEHFIQYLTGIWYVPVNYKHFVLDCFVLNTRCEVQRRIQQKITFPGLGVTRGATPMSIVLTVLWSLFYKTSLAKNVRWSRPVASLTWGVKEGLGRGDWWGRMGVMIGPPISSLLHQAINTL